MNKKEFFEVFKSLCEYYRDDVYKNKKLTAMYYEKVKDVSINEFKKLCDKFINESKFMPKVADFGENYMSYITNMAHSSRSYSKEFLESFYDNI